MRINKRLHPRARIKLPVVVATPDGLVDGVTQNLSLGGAFIRCSGMLDFRNKFPAVITANGRFVLVTAEVVWSDAHSSRGKGESNGMGVSFKRIFTHDRVFLRGVISNRL